LSYKFSTEKLSFLYIENIVIQSVRNILV